MSTFYLVRHAHADWVPDENRPLSPQGKKDTQWVVDKLHLFPITAIYASPYRRAHQTVEPLAKRLHLTIKTIPDLRERQLAGEPVEDFDAAVATLWHNPSFAHPGGESNRAAQQRGVAVINKLIHDHPNDHVVLATHGNLMALILQHFDPAIDYEFWQALRMPDIYYLNLDLSFDANRPTIGQATITRVG